MATGAGVTAGTEYHRLDWLLWCWLWCVLAVVKPVVSLSVVVLVRTDFICFCTVSGNSRASFCHGWAWSSAEDDTGVLPEGESDVLPEDESDVLPEDESGVLPEGESGVLPEGDLSLAKVELD
nr:hypothetical protein BaRGS_003127 [Batillaria attramentaria]